MGRKRIVEIEKEENRKIAELVLKVIGDRSYKEAANDAGIDPSTLSYICRGKVKPTPDVIAAITKPESKPQGGIGLEELMIACGYQSATMERLFAYAEAITGVSIEPMEFSHRVSIEECRLDYMKIMCERLINESILKKGYGILGLETEVQTNGYARANLKCKLADESIGIKEWIFLYDFNIQDPLGGGLGMKVIRKLIFVGILTPEQKVSVVVDTKEKYDAVCRLCGKVPFRGELSVILADMSEGSIGAIKAESYLSHYDYDDSSREIYII